MDLHGKGVVTRTDKLDHITPCLKAPKWLPVVKKLYLRDAVMAFKCINGLTILICVRNSLKDP